MSEAISCSKHVSCHSVLFFSFCNIFIQLLKLDYLSFNFWIAQKHANLPSFPHFHLQYSSSSNLVLFGPLSMEEHNIEAATARKRVRVDSELSCISPDSKRVNSDKGVESSEVELDSPEAKQILDILDDLDSVMGREEVIEDLDSVIRSFEEELHPNNTSSSPEVIQLLSDAAGEFQSDLGYLLEASDDELGLPPTIPNFQEEQANTEPVDLPVAAHPDSVKLGNTIGLEDELATYDSFELGLGDGNNCNYFDTVDGFFDYSEPTDFSWRPESLPAL